MDVFDKVDARRTPRRRRGANLVWNILAAILLLMTACVVLVVLSIYVNPNSAWNPFPPPTLYPSPVLPSATSTLRMTLEPSWTPTVVIPTRTQTPAPTNTPLVTPTVESLPATETPSGPTSTPGDFAFALMDGSPSAIRGDTFHPELGCEWIGVAGQVVDLSGEAVRSQFIHLGGTVEGETISRLTITGSAPAYGLAGYEFIIANRLVGTTQTLWIQLEDVQGLPMSERIYFDTYADCERNLVVIYLQQVR